LVGSAALLDLNIENRMYVKRFCEDGDPGFRRKGAAAP